jgi:hypothetical protein
MIEQNALDFYNKNKDCVWAIPAIPDGLTTLEQARWILNDAPIGWIELDLEIDLPAWQAEAIQAESSFVPHRESNNDGWNSCCMHGIDVEKTGAWTTYGYTNEQDVPYTWTSLSNKTPTVKKFWQNTFPADKYRRVRFMEVEPLSAITPHSDMPGRLPGEQGIDMLDFGVPVNIAVIHPSDCHLVLEGYGIVPFKEGRAFIVNIRNYHSVVNLSNEKRIHVIGHPYGYGNNKEAFAELVVRSYIKQLMRSASIV